MLHPSLSILVIDSYPDAADSTALMFNLCGHQAQVAHSCAEALYLVTAYTPDAVVMDIPLRDGDGLQLAGAMATLLGYRPLTVVVTGLQNMEPKARRAGCDHFFLKPVPPEDLLRVLGEHADQCMTTVGG